MNMKKQLWLTVVTVVRNFIEYGNYKNNKLLALKAIHKIHPHTNKHKIEKMFDDYCKVLIESNKILSTYIKANIQPGSFSNFNDIDYKQYVIDLKSKYPNCGINAIKTLINWIIFWHYLK